MASFSESQRFHQQPLALVAIVAGFAGVGLAAWAIVASGGPVHAGGWFGLAVGAAVMIGLVLAELRVEVRPDGLYVRFFPLTRQHRFAWSEIESAEPRRYRPMREFGGWGVRFSRGGKAYNVAGDRGVQLVFTDGRRLLIGSQRADELAEAIRSARG